jgi:hypothetical protein
MKKPKTLETKIKAAQEKLMVVARAERIGVLTMATHVNDDGLEQTNTIGYIPSDDAAMTLIQAMISYLVHSAETNGCLHLLDLANKLLKVVNDAQGGEPWRNIVRHGVPVEE